MQPDDGADAANDAADTVDIDAAGADTIDRAIGAAERPPTPPVVVPVHTTPTRGVLPRRKKPSSVGAFAATQMGLGVTQHDETTDVVPEVVPVTPGTVLAGRYHVKQLVGQG